MTEDITIINEYRKAFRRYAKDGIIDLDNRLKYKFSFRIYRLETVVKQLEGLVPPNRHSHYLLTFVKKGTGQKSIGPYTFPINKNTLMIIPKRVIHSSSYWSMRCSGYVLSFNIDFFLQKAFPRQHIAGRKIFKISLKPFLTLSEEQAKKLGVIFEYIITEQNEGRNVKDEMIAVKILELLIQCDRFYTETQSLGKEDVYDNIIEQFNELLEKNFSKKRTVRFYADMLHFHPNHLNFLSKKLTGLSAKQIINNRIIQEAKYLLTSSSLTINEIAFKLGFEYPEYFYSFFRKEMNITPLNYKKKYI